VAIPICFGPMKGISPASLAESPRAPRN
jgi:hypothetical protein